MSFARGLYLGKPELPIDHVHVYFPVQIVHKVIAQCKALKLKEIALAAAERYKHNLDNAANNPYVIVGVFEGKCSHEQYPPIPATPTLARVYEEGMLDASFGQIVSFASFYQTCFRVEVPLWHKLEDGIAAPSLDEQAVPNYGLARESPTDKGPSSMGSSNGINSPEDGRCRGACRGGSGRGRKLFFLHEWRRCVCRSYTSHLSRVKKELLDRLHITRKDQSNPTPNKKQHNKTQNVQPVAQLREPRRHEEGETGAIPQNAQYFLFFMKRSKVQSNQGHKSPASNRLHALLQVLLSHLSPSECRSATKKARVKKMEKIAQSKIAALLLCSYHQ